MILKCEVCSHLYDIEDPAYGWEDTLDVSICVNCQTPLRSPIRYVGVLGMYWTLQFIALIFTASNILAGNRDAQFISLGMLAFSSICLIAMDSRKGKPIMLKREKGD